MDNHYLLGIFVVMGVATFITRVLPFVALTKAHDHPLLGRYWKTFAPHDYGGSGVFWLDEPRNRIHYSSRSISAMPDYRDCFALFPQKSVAEYFGWNSMFGIQELGCRSVLTPSISIPPGASWIQHYPPRFVGIIYI